MDITNEPGKVTITMEMKGDGVASIFEDTEKLSTEEEWRQLDALRIFKKHVGLHSNKFKTTDEALVFAFKCGWNAYAEHKRSLQSRIEELLTNQQE